MSETPKPVASVGSLVVCAVLLIVLVGGLCWYVQHRYFAVVPPASVAAAPMPEPEETPLPETTPAPEAPSPSPPADPAKEFAAQVAESQRRAVAAHPDLGKFNSGLNVRFRNKITDLRAHHDPRLNAPNWPENLANAVAKAPALLSLTVANGKKLYFDTEEQRDRYLQAWQRNQPVQPVLPKLEIPTPSDASAYKEMLEKAQSFNAPPPSTSATLKGKVTSVDLAKQILIVQCEKSPRPNGGDTNVDGPAALSRVPQFKDIHEGDMIDVSAWIGEVYDYTNTDGTAKTLPLYEFKKGQFVTAGGKEIK